MMLINPYIFAAGSPPGPDGDPHWANVVALLRFNGDAVDLKGHAFSTTGAVDWVAGKFGQAMGTPSNDAEGVVATPSQSDFDLPGDFTVEMWLKVNSLQGNQALASHFDVGAVNGWQIYMNGNGTLSWYHYAGSGSYVVTGSVDVRTNEFRHIAVSRVAGTMRMFIDGVQDGPSVNNVTEYGSFNLRLSIGYQAQGSYRYPFVGVIDEFRMTKGVGRYTADFTPPTEPFPGS